MGLDETQTKDPEENTRRLIAHVAALRKQVRGLKTSQVIVLVESNLGLEATHAFYGVLRSATTDWCFMREDKGMLGVRTDERLKAQMVYGLGSKLREKCVYWHADMVYVGGDGAYLNTAGIQREACHQLRSYMRIIEPPKTLNQLEKVRYSGKLGGNRDDLAIVIQMNLHGMRLFESSTSRYEAARGTAATSITTATVANRG